MATSSWSYPLFQRADLDAWVASDPYYQLRGWPDIADEQCPCPGQPPLKLMQVLDHNPIHCLDCNMPVPPESIPLPAELIWEVVGWRFIAAAFVALELDRKEYEALAMREWRSLASPLNLRGRALAEKLNTLRRTYYYWHNVGPHQQCPQCGRPTRGHRLGTICEGCSLVFHFS